MRKSGLVKIEKIIIDTFKKRGMDKNLKKQSIIINWEKIVGKEIANNSFVSHIDRTTLILKVKNSVWNHHLSMLKEELIEKVNEYLNEKEIITDIWFTIGYNKYKNDKEVISLSEEQTIHLKLNEKEREEVKKITEELSDERTRKKVTYMLIKEKEREKIKKNKKWKHCLGCDLLIAPEEDYCTVCQIKKNKKDPEFIKENKIKFIKKIFWEVPWIGYEEINEYAASLMGKPVEGNIDNISFKEYELVKKMLINYYLKQMLNEENKNNEEANKKIDRNILVMLLCGIKPEKLTQNYINKVINETKKRLLENRRDKHVFTLGD